MSAAKSSPVKTEEPTLEDRRNAVLETERTIREVSERLGASRTKMAEWKADRRSLVVRARASKDQLAQKSMYSIDEQIAVLTKDIADDEDALRDLGERLVSERNAVALVEWEEERNQVRRQLVAHLQNGPFVKAEKAASQLLASLRAAIEEENRIASMLTAFEPNLHGAASSLRRAQRARAQVIGFMLREVLPVDTRGLTVSQMQGKEAGAYDRNATLSAIESLDRLELVF